MSKKIGLLFTLLLVTSGCSKLPPLYLEQEALEDYTTTTVELYDTYEGILDNQISAEDYILNVSESIKCNDAERQVITEISKRQDALNAETTGDFGTYKFSYSEGLATRQSTDGSVETFEDDFQDALRCAFAYVNEFGIPDDAIINGETSIDADLFFINPAKFSDILFNRLKLDGYIQDNAELTLNDVELSFDMNASMVTVVSLSAVGEMNNMEFKYSLDYSFSKNLIEEKGDVPNEESGTISIDPNRPCFKLD